MWEFYAEYNGKLKRQYLQGNLWSGDPITPLTIQELWMNISPMTISRFLNRPSFQLLVNTDNMDYRMDKIWKITQNNLGSEDKIRHFWWILGLIALNGEDEVWVGGGQGVASQKIEKHMLNFKAKVWWTLA